MLETCGFLGTCCPEIKSEERERVEKGQSEIGKVQSKEVQQEEN